MLTPADSPVLFPNQDALARVLSHAVFDLWGVVNNLTSLRPPRWTRYRVSIFGSARVGVDQFALILAGDMWKGLVAWMEKEMLAAQPQLISPHDLHIPYCVSNCDEAVAILREKHAAWLAAGCVK